MQRVKKTAKKVMVFIMAMIMAVLMSVTTNADVVFQEKVPTTIDAQLKSLLENTSVHERIPVDIWLYDTSTNEDREQKIYSKIGLNKEQITLDTKGTLSSKSVDEYITTERSLYAEERAQQYALIRQDYAKIQGLQETRQTGTRLFFSQYAPMISAELTPTEIELLARDSRVQSIYYSPNMKLEDQGNVSVPAIGANHTRDTLGYTGDGVKIGMIESGIPESSESYFDGADIIYDNISDMESKYTNHANMVAAIMIGQGTSIGGISYKGIVPDATLYATCASDAQDWRARVEWLLSQGVHVINMSASFPDAGYYLVQDQWVDHIAINHCVHFVIAAGSNPLFRVTSPGMAYNAVTVGSLDDNNTLDEEEHSLDDASNYVESRYVASGTIPTNKPDLVAPGVNITTAAGTNSGTSFATPHVTAVVAQLCQRFPSLRVFPAGVKAILLASVSHSQHAYDTGCLDAEEYDKYGAGVVNAKAALETAETGRMVTTAFRADSDPNIGKFYTFSAVAGQRVRVALTWQKHATLRNADSHLSEPSLTQLVDIDLCIYNPDGVLVGDWRADDNNTEVADFIALQEGVYTIEVHLRDSSQNIVTFGLSWWFGEIVDSN